MATDKIPNASPTAASMGSDIYGTAALHACQELNSRLEPYRKKIPNGSFEDIVHAAYFDRVNLSAQGFFKVCSIFRKFKLVIFKVYSQRI